MITTIINTAIGVIVSSILGYFGATIRKVLKEVKILRDSQIDDMRVRISSNFFVYDKLEEVEDYLVIGFQELCEKYFDLGGDSYIHGMYDKSKTWKVKQTGFLK